MRRHPLICLLWALSMAYGQGPLWTLKPDFSTNSASQSLEPGLWVDVNLGSNPASFIAAQYWQLTGHLPDGATVENWLAFMKTPLGPRRIDLAIAMAQSLGKKPRWRYQDPWAEQMPPGPRPEKKVSRDLGAILMYFFNCPRDAVNSKMSWANNHAPGMDSPSPLLAFGQSNGGYYNGKVQPGFWKMELLDGRYAGLDYFLLNANGPDDYGNTLTNLRKAFDELDARGEKNLPGIGLFDDTWAWGKKYFKNTAWETAPDCADPEAAAQKIWNTKWKPIFEIVPPAHWYRFRGRPVIGFYNAGTILSRNQSAVVVARLRNLFQDRFQVNPVILVDNAYFADPAMEGVADARFKWDTFRLTNGVVSRHLGDFRFSHGMPRWDSISRDNGSVERQVKPGDRLVKDDVLFKRILDDTLGDDLALIGTWNDLGEGTGINRCVDYWWDGAWHQPDHFMNLIRLSQGGVKVSGTANP